MILLRRYGRAARPSGPIRVRSVLAGRYRGKGVAERELLTHAVRDDAVRTLCSRIRKEDLVDMYGAEPAGTLPTCPICLEKLRRASQ